MGNPNFKENWSILVSSCEVEDHTQSILNASQFRPTYQSLVICQQEKKCANPKHVSEVFCFLFGLLLTYLFNGESKAILKQR